jgi:hypothetical protein
MYPATHDEKMLGPLACTGAVTIHGGRAMTIQCPECKAPVPDRSAICPNCNHPMGGPSSTEQASKRGKVHQLLSSVLACVGVAMVAVELNKGGNGPAPVLWILGALLALVGSIWFIFASVKA